MRLLVEGWRNLPHSYGLVNCYQILELLKRDEVTLFFRDAPYFSKRWRPMSGIFQPKDEEILNSLPFS